MTTLNRGKNWERLIINLLPVSSKVTYLELDLVNNSFASRCNVRPYSRGHWRDTARHSREGGFSS